MSRLVWERSPAGRAPRRGAHALPGTERHSIREMVLMPVIPASGMGSDSRCGEGGGTDTEDEQGTGEGGGGRWASPLMLRPPAPCVLRGGAGLCVWGPRTGQARGHVTVFVC